MNPEELKKLLEEAVALGKKTKEETDGLKAQVDAKTATIDELVTKFNEFKSNYEGEEGGKPALSETKEFKDLTTQINELLDEVSDLRKKMKTPNQVVTPEQKQALHDNVIKPAIGEWVKAGKKEGKEFEFFGFIKDRTVEKFKALNITNPDEGGRTVAEVLSRDVIEYAREFSPILSLVGRKASMTRNFRELVLVSYPGVSEGIENVPGTSFPETSTQEYKEVKSKEFKVSAKPRITDEAMYGSDIDLYGDLVRLLGQQVSIYLAAQVLFGNGSGKNARGILSSNRVDITDNTGESWKPTLATDPDNARSADFYRAYSTGVSGALGVDDEAIIDLLIDIKNTLPTMYLNGSSWTMNRNTQGVLEKVRDAENRPILISSYRDGGELRLLGFPVNIDDTYPDLAADSTPVTFGRLDLAYAINDGDIDKMLIDPYSVDDCTVIKYSKEMFEMVQQSDALLVVAATTNGPAA